MTAKLAIFHPECDSPHEITVSRVVDLYLRVMEGRAAAGDLSSENFLNTQRDLRNLSSFLRDTAVSACTQADFESWFASNPQWKSGHTKKRIQAEALCCFEWAADPTRGNLIDRVPFRSLRQIASIPYVPRRAAERDEIVALMRHSQAALRRSLFFCYRTGCRPCEMRELIWPWVHLDTPAPHLALEKHKTVRKTGKPRIIGLDAATVRLLRWLEARRDHGMQHVFANNHGRPWLKRSFSQAVARAAVRAGLDGGSVKRVSAGCLRTTYACDLIEAGFTDRQAADMLGHTSTWMVDHVYGSHTRQRAAHLDDLAKKIEKSRKTR